MKISQSVSFMPPHCTSVGCASRGVSMAHGGDKFTMESLADKAIWLDSSDASTLTLTGSGVDEWRDKSGNARHLNAFGASRPTRITAAQNGLDVIASDGVDDVIYRGSTGIGRNVSGLTIYIVHRWITPPVGSACGFILSTGPGTLTRAGFGSGGFGGGGATKQVFGGRRLDTPDSFQYAESVSDIHSTFKVTVAVFDYQNATLNQYIGGSSEGSKIPFQTAGNTSDTNSGSITLFSDVALSVPSAIAVGEFAIIHQVHNASLRATVKAHLEQKWGIS